jgi:hypothetical protein
MSAANQHDECDDLEATIRECAATDPGFRGLVDAAYERQEREFLARLGAAHARGTGPGAPTSATAAERHSRRHLTS